MPIYDYRCPSGHIHEHRCRIADRPAELPCPDCGASSKQAIIAAPALPTTIVVDYPGSKKHKAGYRHTHGDYKGTAGKIQVGYGGKIVTHDEPAPAKEEGIWHNPLE